MHFTSLRASFPAWSLALSVLLVACGGGGGASSALPPGGGPGIPTEPPAALLFWQGAELLEEQRGQAQDVHVATDAVGNGIAVWVQPQVLGGRLTSGTAAIP